MSDHNRNLVRANPVADGRIKLFGCPWHGFKNKLDLYDVPGGSLRQSFALWPTYSAFDGGGSTNLLKVPGLSSITRTAEEQARDTANGHEWLNYGLIAGRTLHGQDLLDQIIYIDPENTLWLIDIDSVFTTSPSNGWTVTATLSNVFGRIAHVPYPVIDRELDTLFDDTLDLHIGEAVGRIETGPWVIEQNSTGSVAMIHVYITGEGIIERELSATNNSTKMELAGVFKLQVSGTGDLDRDHLGDGITASLTLHKGQTDCYNSYTAPAPDGEYMPLPTRVNHLETTPFPDPPCEETYTETYTSSANVTPLEQVPNNINYIDRLLRVTFDENDQEVSYTSKQWWDERDLNYSYTTDMDSYRREIIWETEVDPDATGFCRKVVPALSDITTGYTEITMDHDHVASGSLQLLRNGANVSTSEAAVVTHVHEVDRSDTGYSSSQTVEQTLNGAPLPAGPQSNSTFVIHAYSPQIMGVKDRSAGLYTGDHWARLSTVAVPWGTDSAHDGYWITGVITRWLYGTQDPVKQIAYWYDPGVTDQQDAEINFV